MHQPQPYDERDERARLNPSRGSAQRRITRPAPGHDRRADRYAREIKRWAIDEQDR